MWITISSDHNPDSRLRPSATAVHNDGMNSKTKRKHTNGFNEDRLMLICSSAGPRRYCRNLSCLS